MVKWLMYNCIMIMLVVIFIHLFPDLMLTSMGVAWGIFVVAVAEIIILKIVTEG